MIKTLINQAIIKLSEEINRTENTQFISKEIIEPIVNSISSMLFERFYFFFVFTGTIFVLTFLFAFIIMITVIIKK